MSTSSTRIYIGNLSYNLTESEVSDVFAKHGNVVSFEIMRERETGRSRGFGFIEFETSEQAQAAKAEDGTDLNGRNIKVNEAKERQKGGPPRRGGRGGKQNYGGGFGQGGYGQNNYGGGYGQNNYGYGNQGNFGGYGGPSGGYGQPYGYSQNQGNYGSSGYDTYGQNSSGYGRNNQYGGAEAASKLFPPKSEAFPKPYY